MTVGSSGIDIILPIVHAGVVAMVIFHTVFIPRNNNGNKTAKAAAAAVKTSAPMFGKQLKLNIFVPNPKPRTIASILTDILPAIYDPKTDDMLQYFYLELRKCHIWSNFMPGSPFTLKFSYLNVSLWLTIAILTNVQVILIQKGIYPLTFCLDDSTSNASICHQFNYHNIVYEMIIVCIVANIIHKFHLYLFSELQFYFDFIRKLLPQETAITPSSNMIVIKPKPHAMKTSTIYVTQSEEQKCHSLDDLEEFNTNIQREDLINMEDQLQLLQSRKVTLFRAIRYYILQKTIDFVPINNETSFFMFKKLDPIQFTEKLQVISDAHHQRNATVIEKYTKGDGDTNTHSMRWQQTPVEFDSLYHWINYLKQFYKYIQYSYYRVGGNPKRIYSFLTFARLIYPNLISRQLLSVRQRTRQLHNALLDEIPPYFLPHQLPSVSHGRILAINDNTVPFPRHINKCFECEHDILFLEYFLLEWFEGYYRSLLFDVFRDHNEQRRRDNQWEFFFTDAYRFIQLHSSERNFENVEIFCNRYKYFLLLIHCYVGGLIAVAVYCSRLLVTGNVFYTLYLILANYLFCAIVFFPYSTLLWKLILPLMAKQEFQRLYFVLTKRFPRIFCRNTRYLQNVHCLLQHFHPVCRLARIFPQYPISRWLITLQDDDLPNTISPCLKTPYDMESLDTGSVLFRDNLLVIAGNVDVFVMYYWSRIIHYLGQGGKLFFHLIFFISSRTLREIVLEGMVALLFYVVGMMGINIFLLKQEIAGNAIGLFVLIFVLLFFCNVWSTVYYSN